MEERLIEAVRARECLYNYHHRMYKNLKYKELIWQEVAKTVGVDVKKCKQRWKSLRDRARREYFSTPSDSASNINWPYMKSLRFIKSFIKPAETSSKFSTSPIVKSFDNQPDESRSTSVSSFQPPDAFQQTPKGRKMQISEGEGIFMFLQNLGEKILRANFTDEEELEIQEALIGTLRIKMMEIKQRTTESQYSDEEKY